MSEKNAVVIVSALRSAVGNFNGGLASLPASKLGEEVIKALLAQSTIDPSQISEVIMGQVLTAGTGQNPARQASLGAGLPKEVPAWLINQVCGSGLRSVALGYQAIISGASSIVIAGGQENMSQAPHFVHMRNGTKMGDASLVDSMVKDGLWDVYNNYHMGITAENIASQFNISRSEQDEFACLSQNKAQRAQDSGAFNDEIVPITISDRKGDIVIDKDEFIRPNTVIDNLAKLRPAFSKDGTVTAGNASGVNDGAAAVILMSEAEAKQRNLKSIARIKSFAQSGVDPKIMGTGPIPASRKALEIAGWNVADLDIIEANEAFAAQAICVNKQMGWDINKVNINGGAIAIGHPIGASGTRILVTMLHAMKKNNLQKGLATLCVGGGMGVALCVEKI